MSADDQNYLSWMASAALAVLMVVVMFWIRSQIPDDTSADITPMQTVAADDTTASNDNLLPARAAMASVYECVSGDSRTLSDGPCGAGAVLRQMGVAHQQQGGDPSRVHHR